MACTRCVENGPRDRYCMFCGDELTATSIVAGTNPTTPALPFEEPDTPTLLGVPIIRDNITPPYGGDAPSTVPAPSLSVGPRSQATSAIVYSVSPGQDHYDTYDDYDYDSTPTRAVANLWGPFAGYGNRRRHVGWLLNDQGHQLPQVISQVHQRFDHRSVPDAEINPVVLTAQGLLAERRYYFMLKLGLVSMALYINRFGNDLYVSLSSYLKPPINPLRVLVMVLMLLFSLFMFTLYAPALQNAAYGTLGGLIPGGGGNTGSISNLAFLLCVVGPLGTLNNIALVLLFAFSVYKFLTEKDFLAALRTRPNEFDEDDLIVMEKAVEETVRQSLTDLHLNPNDLRLVTTPRGEATRLF